LEAKSIQASIAITTLIDLFELVIYWRKSCETSLESLWNQLMTYV